MDMTGQQWASFLSDPKQWPDGAYMDDVLIHVNGEKWSSEKQTALGKVPAAAEVVIECGFVVINGARHSLISTARKWLDANKGFGGARTFRELKTLCDRGARFTVAFERAVEDSEGYLEEGMRGVLSAPVEDHGDHLVFQVDLEAHEAHNDAVSKPNYYDNNGNPTLTAKQAGHYPKNHRETLYADSDRALHEVVKPAPAAANNLMEEFAASGDTSYISWLERTLIDERETAKKRPNEA